MMQPRVIFRLWEALEFPFRTQGPGYGWPNADAINQSQSSTDYEPRLTYCRRAYRNVRLSRKRFKAALNELELNGFLVRFGMDSIGAKLFPTDKALKWLEHSEHRRAPNLFSEMMGLRPREGKVTLAK